MFYDDNVGNEKKSKKKSIKEFITTNEVKVQAYSTGQSARGAVFGSYRPDFIVLDDIENDRTIVSEPKTEQVIHYIDELFAGLSGDANILVLGNRLTNSGSISYVENRFKGDIDFVIRDVPVMIDDEITWPDKYVRTNTEAKIINKEIVDPKEQVISLEFKKKFLGETVYNREMMNQPLSDDMREIKWKWLQNYYTELDIKDRLRNRYITIDVADTKERDNRKVKGKIDYTGIVVVDWDIENYWYIKYAKRRRVNAPELIDEIFRLWEYYKPIKIGIEKKSFEDQIKPYIEQRSEETGIYPVVVELEHGGTHKVDRIRGALQGRLQAGKIKFLSDSNDNTEELRNELYDFPKAEYDDLCLNGNTKISTLFGSKAIKNIKKGNLIITPFGIRKVLTSKFTGFKKVISNLNIIGTPDHPVYSNVYSNNRFIRLDNAKYKFISRLNVKEQFIWKYKKLLYLMKQNTNLWEGKRSIILVSQEVIRKENVLKDFTWRFGNFIINKKFKRAMKFIIKILILLITTLIIYSVYKLGKIVNYIGKVSLKNIKNILFINLKKYQIKQKNGINQKKVENGIKNIIKKVWHKLNYISILVYNVIRYLSQIGLKKLNFVQINAHQNIEYYQGLIMNKENVLFAENLQKKLCMLVEVIESDKINLVITAFNG